MSATTGSDERRGISEPLPPAGEPIGEEVRIGGGPAPRWLRYWFYLIYVWAILYLLIQDVEQYWLLACFAALLTAWLVYIVWKKKPPEP